MAKARVQRQRQEEEEEAVAPLPRPAGRPLGLSCKFLEGSSFVEEALAEIAKTSSVVIASYLQLWLLLGCFLVLLGGCTGPYLSILWGFLEGDVKFNEANLEAAVGRRLTAKALSACKVFVDREQQEGKHCRGQHVCVDRLKKSGAEVFLCKGNGPRVGLGSMRVKCIILDSQIAYHGSGNLTTNLLLNVESVARVTGPPVQELLESILIANSSRHSLVSLSL